MLYHARMDVRPPQGLDLAGLERLKAEQKALAKLPQRGGQWVHPWRIAGQHSNYSEFDVANHAELHSLLSSLPLFPFMEITVTPLARRPSAVERG